MLLRNRTHESSKLKIGLIGHVLLLSLFGQEALFFVSFFGLLQCL